MNTPLNLIALCASVVLLTACDKTAPAPPTPMLSQPVAAEPGATASSEVNTSVPSAESVLPPANAASADPALGATDGTRKPKQESETKLLPGQNNDHSAPLNTAK
ncbi:hypothetical protein [Hydrogenophaga taeniospiralis]|uniref:hypothetical protein n=1 Tax=Hydrogenophaga taeniospiralis TaxID=65656 RepID=UPI001CFBE3B6|nr:hypothetical protein [Hydrogenophaga taeniospiralis]UCU93182.1 hypothetical protein KI616_20610 [Hydrogenophaga taeniospiralis]